MKKLAIAVTAVAAFTGSAIAADMPVKAPSAPMVRAVSWTGCYVGAGGGYGMHNADHDQAPANTVTATEGGRGYLITAGVGCDYQFMGSWLVGAFVDGEWSNIKGQYHDRFSDMVGEFKQSRSWAAGARIGYLVTPTLLTYFDGGFAQTRVDGINFCTITTCAPTTLSFDAQNYNGYFLGGGTEYALGWLPGLFWKNEYRLATYRSKDVDVLSGGVPTGEIDHVRLYTQTIRTSLVWRFGAP
jgi:outer membrane immunogenic protein